VLEGEVGDAIRPFGIERFQSFARSRHEQDPASQRI